MSDAFSNLSAELAAALGAGYSVDRPLGAGGFAVVFRVRDLGLRRDLAVKVLSPDMITSHTVLERFRREAELIAQLAHPNIVPLHFIGERDGLLWLAMQCVDGGSIADQIEQHGKLGVEQVTQMMREVASALAYAHRRGVVHRDIKPANVLIDRETGRCLVTDFGIARSAEAAQLTATGMTLGTPAYLSPEQVTGEPADHRVDIYALGVMAYECLAGRVPFDAPTPTAAMMKRLAGPPTPIGELRDDIPSALAATIDRCLAADLSERFANADEVIASLGSDAKLQPSRARIANAPRRNNRRAAVIAGIASVIAVVVALVGALAQRFSRAAVPVVQQGTSSVPDDSTLVPIAAGLYTIGSNTGRPNARPEHSERVAAFRIGRTEVTVGEYAQFVRATNRVAPWGNTQPASALPVTRASFGDAANYCAWRYRDGGRLPTEVEWEAAARGKSGRTFPYGSEAGPAIANTASAHQSSAAPVGSFPRSATPEGIQDMSGNVWEWTSSRMRAYPGGAPLPDSLLQYHVIRGGAFNSADSVASATYRGYQRADAAPDALPYTGFRCVAR